MKKKLLNSIGLFEKETGKKLKVIDGKPYFDGCLHLRDTSITSLPDNLKRELTAEYRAYQGRI